MGDVSGIDIPHLVSREGKSMRSIQLPDDMFFEMIDVCSSIAINLAESGIETYIDVLTSKFLEDNLYIYLSIDEDFPDRESIGIATLCLTDSRGYARARWSFGDLPDRIMRLHVRMKDGIGRAIKDHSRRIDMTEEQRKYAESKLLPIYDMVHL